MVAVAVGAEPDPRLACGDRHRRAVRALQVAVAEAWVVLPKVPDRLVRGPDGAIVLHNKLLLHA